MLTKVITVTEKEKELWWNLYDACVENYKSVDMPIPDSINDVVDALFEKRKKRLSSPSDDTK